ncbi:hypothetical protein [Clostridium sp. AM58-1XD]|uniref:hypothetical protein n=1 Tax=Clostridium sp. AM58-1XD TaxID=2292307 RepID=UPI0015F51705|nr:hypothetical protein [Clostridium sp. AM58-1XD]
MNSRLIIDGNSVYEIDEDCMKRKKEHETRGNAEGRRRTWIQEETEKGSDK